MKFENLAGFFSEIEKITSRNEMTKILSDIYNEAKPDEVAMISYLVVGRVAPLFIQAEFNIATKSLIKVLGFLADSYKLRVDVKKMNSKLGDPGLVAQEIIEKSKSKTKGSLSISEVYGLLWEVVGISGTGSVEHKKKMIVDLLGRLSSLEARYVVRILGQQLRLGCSSKTVLDALSFVRMGNKDDREDIEDAFGISSDLGYVAQKYIQGGKKELEKIKVVPGVPIFSMLVEREKDPGSIMKRIKNPMIQPKFDGLRCQIHVGINEEQDYKGRIWSRYLAKERGEQPRFFGGEGRSEVKLFSRNLGDMTSMFPDVVESAKKIKVKSGIFDAEVVGYNENTQEFATFQSTMVRKRKYDIKETARKQPIKVFVFDVLYKNGKSLLSTPNKERISMLKSLVPKGGKIVHSETVVVKDVKGLENEFRQKINAGLEGIIAKDPDSLYQPGVRGFDWIKFKRASQGQLADTVDVVILGYYFGRGRQVEFGMGALLGGVYDKKKDRFVTLTKIGTGITDEKWRKIKRDMDEISVSKRPGIVLSKKNIEPDIWVRPEIVATVEADEITRSPVHTTGEDKNGVGYALRFPRLKVWKRDKIAEECTSVAELVRMYKLSRKE